MKNKKMTEEFTKAQHMSLSKVVGLTDEEVREAMIEIVHPIEKKQSIGIKLLSIKVGVLPLPLYLIFAAIVFGAAYFQKLPADMIGGFAVIMVIGILLGDLGMRIPILKDIGGPAILSILIPSAAVFYHWINPEVLKAITAIMKTSNFFYFYISCLVVGSILGMNRKVLIQGFLKMFIPLIGATLAAVFVGIGVGLLFGYTPHHTFFYIVAPILGGGIGEGILPLSLSYSEILHRTQDSFVAFLVPAAMLGNITAIISSGIMKKIGEKRPEINGNGLLVKTGEDKRLREEQKKNFEKPIEFSLMGAGLIMSCIFFIFGSLASKFIGIPGPVIMIFTAVVIKCSKLMPEQMELGAYHLYKFITSSLTWPLMAGLGVLYIPWKDFIAAITPAYIIICVSIVISVVTSGFFIGKLMNMYPMEASIVTACHSGLGGTGDIAILSSANRMELMSFAQISTRIGGASMIVLASLLMKIFG
ncbi:MAG TPA: 2-hydroxycarboxylate transporter family protein [Ruminiclostridium sp.]|nr:2-hydroxycarboxylate transporter family protein [Ruminiclostridium sp.]